MGANFSEYTVTVYTSDMRNAGTDGEGGSLLDSWVAGWDA